MVNVYLVSRGDSGSRGWVLIDAGIRGYGQAIRAAAAEVFGDRPPETILLTHGHFDHVGSLPSLLRMWDVAVHAHVSEFPFLTGRLSYPPPDPSVGGGLMSRLSLFYPRGPITIGPRLLALEPGGRVPGLDGWEWHHTPGHSPGHVSFFRPEDRVLIAGDAVVTVRQESAAAVVAERAEVRPPPAYFTIDWTAAERSVSALAAMEPNVLATGHGRAMAGPVMRLQLDELVRHFDRERPRHGRYVAHPAHPEAAPSAAVVGFHRARPASRWLGAAAGATVAGAAVMILRRRASRKGI
jgi:glyoxylase-like metal-dependent hydrolase (beta-lactamase superfamily II)